MKVSIPWHGSTNVHPIRISIHSRSCGGKRMYSWAGWFDGRADCEPSEPGKYWIEIRDDDYDEFCIIVHRSADEELDNSDPVVIAKENRAQYIVDALNFRAVEYEAPM